MGNRTSNNKTPIHTSVKKIQAHHKQLKGIIKVSVAEYKHFHSDAMKKSGLYDITKGFMREGYCDDLKTHEVDVAKIRREAEAVLFIVEAELKFRKKIAKSRRTRGPVVAVWPIVAKASEVLDEIITRFADLETKSQAIYRSIRDAPSSA